MLWKYKTAKKFSQKQELLILNKKMFQKIEKKKLP